MKLVPLLLLAAACGSSEMLRDGAEGSFELRAGTVIDPPDPAALPAGTVVITSEGLGAIRRILGDDGGLVTAPASLFDAFATARYRGRVTLEPLDAAPRVEPDDRIVATGELALAPQIELAFELDDEGLASFDAAVRGTFSARLESFTHLAGMGWDGVTTIASRPQRYAWTIDGVPVVIVARAITDLAVYAGGAATLHGEVTADVALDAGIHFTRADGWSTSDASEPAVVVQAFDATGIGHTTVVATMRLELALYGEVVPYFQLRAISSAEAGTCQVFEGYVGAGAGVEPSTILPGAEMRLEPVFGAATPLVTDETCR